MPQFRAQVPRNRFNFSRLYGAVQTRDETRSRGQKSNFVLLFDWRLVLLH